MKTNGEEYSLVRVAAAFVYIGEQPDELFE